MQVRTSTTTIFPPVSYKRIPAQGWDNDYCTSMGKSKGNPVGQFIDYIVNENTKIHLYYYPVPKRLNLSISCPDVSCYLKVLGDIDSLRVISKTFLSIYDIEKNIHLIKELAKNKLVDPAIIDDVEKSISKRPNIFKEYRNESTPQVK